ncbi:MAG: hypothetical protein AAFN27_03995 [Pseudomonadota bacterium]
MGEFLRHGGDLAVLRTDGNRGVHVIVRCRDVQARDHWGNQGIGEMVF